MAEIMTGTPVKESRETAAAQAKRLKVYRHELKYFISFTDQKLMSEAFQKTLERDPFCKENNEYWIRSLYFDTVDNDDFYDKEIGVMRRKKIRLRIYDVNQPWVKIEIKNKSEQYMMKETAGLNREETMALINGNTEILLSHDNEVLNNVYYFMSRDFYRPALIVDYEREAYIAPIENIRITFDKNIRASATDFDFFNPHLNLQPVFDDPTMVLEVKYNHFLPTWLKDILSSFNSERYAISKYCLGRFIY